MTREFQVRFRSPRSIIESSIVCEEGTITVAADAVTIRGKVRRSLGFEAVIVLALYILRDVLHAMGLLHQDIVSWSGIALSFFVVASLLFHRKRTVCIPHQTVTRVRRAATEVTLFFDHAPEFGTDMLMLHTADVPTARALVKSLEHPHDPSITYAVDFGSIPLFPKRDRNTMSGQGLVRLCENAVELNGVTVGERDAAGRRAFGIGLVALLAGYLILLANVPAYEPRYTLLFVALLAAAIVVGLIAYRYLPRPTPVRIPINDILAVDSSGPLVVLTHHADRQEVLWTTSRGDAEQLSREVSAMRNE